MMSFTYLVKFRFAFQSINNSVFQLL